MKKVLIAIEVNELPGEDLDLSHAVADVVLYPNIELADDYINRIGRWFYAKVRPLPLKDPYGDPSEDYEYGYNDGWNDCIKKITEGWEQ